MSADEWDAVLKVHLYGSYNVTRAAMPHFREQGYGRTRNVLANAVSPIASTRMSAGVPEDEFDPAYVSVLVALLGEECTTSGEVIHAAGGHYTRARNVESRGADFGNVPSVEALAEKWDEIMDMEHRRPAAAV